MSHVKWMSIENLHNVIRSVKKYQLASDDMSIIYRAKVKLHGTNAGIRIENGRVVAQSRTRDLTVSHDNYGFADFVDRTRSLWDNFVNTFPEGSVIFGEWCGPGINSGTSVQMIDRRIFAVFSILVNEEKPYHIVEPDKISSHIPEHPDIFIIPWQFGIDAVNFFNQESLDGFIDGVNAAVDECEREDPVIKATFGISGTGEGYVYYPCPFIPSLMFKAKGKKHRTNAHKKAATVNVQPNTDVSGFVEVFATEARFEQGLSELNQGVFDKRNIGNFLKWVAQDIMKESEYEREESGIEWKVAAKKITEKARDWYLSRC